MRNLWMCVGGGLAVAVLSGSILGAAVAAEEALPPNAKPGECYARVFVPPVYKTEAKDVLKREAYEKLEIAAAKYETATEKVLVKEASEKLEIVPAQYEWVEERVMIKPAVKKIVEVPAVYETVKEKVVDTPEHTVWKEGRGPVEKVDHGTGEIMCLVTMPATYKTVTKRVLKTPATTKEIETPAKYTTIKKRVVKAAPTVKKTPIPAQYKEIQVQKLVTAPAVKRIPVPAEYQKMSQRTLVAESRMEWQPILCQTNTTPGIVLKIQQALKNAGHNPGPIDGVIGSQTRTAIQAFQKQKGLAVGGLTIETIKALGVA